MPIAEVIQGHKYIARIAKQAAAGTPETTAEFQAPVYTEGFKPVQVRNPLEVAQGDLYLPGEFISQVSVAGAISFSMHPLSLGRLLGGQLGLDTVSGGSDPFLHTFTLDGTFDWYTIWIGRPLSGGTTEWDRIYDAKLVGITIEYVAGQLLHANCAFLGARSQVKASAPTVTTTESLTHADEKYTWAAPSLKLDLDATPAVTSVTNLTNFDIFMGLERAELVWTQNVHADFIDLGQWSWRFTSEMVLQNWDPLYTTFYGTRTPSANTELSSTVVRGAIDFTLNTAPTNANRELRFQIPNVLFSTEAPDANLDGRGLRMPLTGILQKPAAGEPVTTTLENSRSSAY